MFEVFSLPRFTTYNPHLSLGSKPVSVALVIPLTLVLILISFLVTAGGVTGISSVSFSPEEQEVIVIGKIRQAIRYLIFTIQSFHLLIKIALVQKNIILLNYASSQWFIS